MPSPLIGNIDLEPLVVESSLLPSLRHVPTVKVGFSADIRIHFPAAMLTVAVFLTALIGTSAAGNEPNLISESSVRLTVLGTARCALEFVTSNVTGHVYGMLGTRAINWQAAKQAAEQAVYQGMKGHLVTVTSQEELDLVADLITSVTSIQHVYWTAGSDDVRCCRAQLERQSSDQLRLMQSMGAWSWQSGPEAGRLFYTQGWVEGFSSQARFQA